VADPTIRIDDQSITPDEDEVGVLVEREDFGLYVEQP
jgi:hypothetical protein